MIEQPPVLVPDAARSERTRMLCHHKLRLRRQRLERQSAVNQREFATQRAVLAGFCLVYMAAVVGNVVRVLLGG